MIGRPLVLSIVTRYAEAIEIVEIQGYLAVLGGLFSIIFALGFSMAILKMLRITKS
jgi:hypothetical protein